MNGLGRPILVLLHKRGRCNAKRGRSRSLIRYSPACCIFPFYEAKLTRMLCIFKRDIGPQREKMGILKIWKKCTPFPMGIFLLQSADCFLYSPKRFNRKSITLVSLFYLALQHLLTEKNGYLSIRKNPAMDYNWSLGRGA